MAVPIFMVIMGYLWAASFAQKGVESLADAYGWPIIRAKIVRFLLPFAIVFTCQVVYFYLYKTLYKPNFLLTVGSVVHDLIYAGGWGPGSYYVPVLVQLVFLFPLIYFLVKRYGIWGLLITIGLNIGYEVMQAWFGMGAGLYRILAFRYLAVVALGAYLYFAAGEIPVICQWLFFGVGMIFLVSYCYCGYRPWWQPYWATTSWMACGLIVPFAVQMMDRNWNCWPLELLGQASYHIFLAQMAYFNQLSWIVGKVTNSFSLTIILNVLLCVVLGVVFYELEKKLRRTYESKN